MRQRITFLQSPEDAVDPKSIKVEKDSISRKGLKAAREERITFGFEELPQEIYRVLKASHELHVRWVSERNYETAVPLVSRLSPGLHVFYTPQRNSSSSELLCPILKKAFGELDCVSPERSFTTLPVERFSHSAATQYFSPLPSINSLTEYISHRICTSELLESDPPDQIQCLSRVSALKDAASIDMNYDTIAHALTLTAYFPPCTQDLHITKPPVSSSRLEVGILNIERAQEPEELSLGGFLTVIGEDTKPSPTLFSFPARHHPALSQSFTSSFKLPTGLHPTLELNITGFEPPMDDRKCSMHAHLTLPRNIFADRYQLSDPLFLASKGLVALHYITTPVDLEAPTYTMDIWGSSLLVELWPPSPTPKSQASRKKKKRAAEESWNAEIPLHLRYLPPNSESDGLEGLEFPYPVLFWACTADEGSKFPINPFDRVNLGYDGLFGPRTLFYHLSPNPSHAISDSKHDVKFSSGGGTRRLINTLNVPVLDLNKSSYVENGTAVVVFLGFLWVTWCLVRVWRSEGYGNGSGWQWKEDGEKKDQ